MKVGDDVRVKKKFIQSYSRRPEEEVLCTIKSVRADDVSIIVPNYLDCSYSTSEESRTFRIKKENITRDTGHIGANPFNENVTRYRSNMRRLDFDVESIIFALKLQCPYYRSFRNKDTKFDDINGKPVYETNFNPYVYLKDGTKYYYQRDYVWTKKDEIALIDSIYNGIDCGKIVIRNRPYNLIEKETKSVDSADNVYWRDVVDGKQRLLCLQRFMNDEFKDSNGYYFSDLSQYAQRMFMDSNSFTYLEILDRATDNDILNIFININTRGKIMDSKVINNAKEYLNKC